MFYSEQSPQLKNLFMNSVRETSISIKIWPEDKQFS